MMQFEEKSKKIKLMRYESFSQKNTSSKMNEIENIAQNKFNSRILEYMKRKSVFSSITRNHDS